MGQIARSADRKLLARLNERLALVVPEGARELGRGIDVYRNMPGTDVFVATAFVRWKSPRGKEGSFSARGTGRGAQAANDALRTLLDRVQHPETAPPLAKREASRRREGMPASPRPARRSRATERGMATAARRLLGYLVPEGATKVRRSVKVARRADESPTCDAHAVATWVDEGGRPGQRVVTASDESAEPFGGALASLLGKLERVAIR